jgi:signal transduction histidine kinase
MSSSSQPAGTDAVASAQLRALGEFILARREDITRHWVGAVDRSPRVESSSGLTFRQLLDHFPLLCSELADILRAPAAEAPREQASRDSASHGRLRWQQGYRLDEVIREICIIRRDFLVRWLKVFEAENGGMDTTARKAAKRLIHGFFDDVMIGATVQFVQQHDHQVQQLGSQSVGERKLLNEAGQAGTRFLSLVSHELRTPLTPVLLDLATMEKDQTISDELRQVVSRILHNVDVEVALIDDLLDATRLAQGPLELQLGQANIHELLGSQLSACELLYSEKQLALEVQMNATVTNTTADGLRLRRAFGALLRNIANVSESGTHVEVSTRNNDRNDEIEIVFEDGGADFDASVAELVFLPFEKGRPSTFGIGRLGVARYVAKAVVEAHGGTLTATRGRSRGAIYTLTLPVHE